MSDKQVREHDKFMLRLPDGMREHLKSEAASNKRSLNAEIVDRLEATLPHRIELDGSESDKVHFLMVQLKGIQERMSRLSRDAEYIQGRLLEELSKERPTATPRT